MKPERENFLAGASHWSLGRFSSSFLIWLIFLFGLALISLLIFIWLGPVPVKFSFSDFFAQLEAMLGRKELSEPGIIWLKIRLPRALAGLLVGGGLALAGACFQAILRNPLADPYLLGVSGGSALGAILGMLIFSGRWGFALVPVFAFAGAIVAIFLVIAVARTQGKLPVLTLLLAGVVVNAFFSALVMLILSLSPHRHLPEAVFWMMGKLSSADYLQIGLLLIYYLPGMGFLLSLWRDFNLFALGDEPAQQLGVEVERTKLLAFIFASLLTASAVSISGLIGFVGLMVPHFLRIIFGPDHRFLLPASFLLGGSFLIFCDLGARTIIAPAELPVGVITAILGGPFFIWLLSRARGELGR